LLYTDITVELTSAVGLNLDQSLGVSKTIMTTKFTLL